MPADRYVDKMAMSMTRINEILLLILETAQVIARLIHFRHPLSLTRGLDRNRQIKMIRVTEGLSTDPTSAVHFRSSLKATHQWQKQSAFHPIRTRSFTGSS
jgi:hypothetical protein